MDIIIITQKVMEDKVWDSGHVTGSKLLEVLNEFQQKSLASVDQRHVEIRNEFPSKASNCPIHPQVKATHSSQLMWLPMHLLAMGGAVLCLTALNSLQANCVMPFAFCCWGKQCQLLATSE
jgi:hypothetical protein